MTDQSAPSGIRRHLPTGARVIVVVLVFLALAGIALAVNTLEASNRSLQRGQQAQATVIAQLASGLDTTRQQLKQHHVTPSAPAASSIVRGVPGVPGVPGPAGPSGAPGRDAPTITPSPGVSGASGAPGKPGADSTVRGPSGPPGPSSTVAGPSGPPGPAGQNGVNGTDGKDGKDGQPPAGWTYTWTDSVGVTHTVACTRASNFDPSAPQYDCTDQTASPSASAPANPQAGLLALSAVAARRRKHARSSPSVGRHRAGGQPGAHC